MSAGEVPVDLRRGTGDAMIMVLIEGSMEICGGELLSQQSPARAPCAVQPTY